MKKKTARKSGRRSCNERGDLVALHSAGDRVARRAFSRRSLAQHRFELLAPVAEHRRRAVGAGDVQLVNRRGDHQAVELALEPERKAVVGGELPGQSKIGRASCRERVEIWEERASLEV